MSTSHNPGQNLWDILSFYQQMLLAFTFPYPPHPQHNVDGRPSNANMGHAQDSNTGWGRGGGGGGKTGGKLYFNNSSLSKFPNWGGEGGGGGGVNRRKILSYQLLLGQMS